VESADREGKAASRGQATVTATLSKARKREVVVQGGAAVTVSLVVLKDTAVAVHGYVLPVRRLAAAAEANPSNPGDVYIALFEAMNWLVSIADRCSLRGNADVQAVTLARHRTHHASASAIQQLDPPSGIWSWRPLESLPYDPKYRSEGLEPSYSNRLADEPMLEVFRRLEPVMLALAPTANPT
jgi:hypothetical protein